MFLARRNLLKDKTRLALSVVGIALAIMLILVLNGFLAGMNQQITSYLNHSPGSIVVAQEDVVNLLGATSLLPEGVASQVEAIRGVKAAIPILSQFVILDLHEQKQPTYMVGYDPNQGGGPWRLSAGRPPQAKREMVFDQTLAQRHGLHIGDVIEVQGQDFTITGLSRDTSSWMTSFFFVRKEDAEDLILDPGATSFLLLVTTTDANLAGITRQVNTISGVNAITKPEMAANDLKLFAKIFSLPLKLMIGIAFLVGTLIVGLVIYTITIERQQEYGVLKAIGANNRTLYQVILTQSLAAAFSGTILGMLVAYTLSQWIMAIRPQFLIILAPADIQRALFAGLGMALVAALIPAQTVARLAPAEVYRK